MPEVSVVIPSYNGAARLPRLLGSLARQEGIDWEAIVVLDGSKDESADIVAWASHAMPVRCIDLGVNRGRPTALNTGFATATGRVLVRSDDDLELPPTFLRNHAAHHAGDPVGVIGMCPDVFDDTAYARAYGRQADVGIREMAYALPPEKTWRLWSANVSVTRATYDRVGPYDDDYRVYGWEDVDWGYRLSRTGTPIIIPRDIEALHHNPATSATERASKAFASGESRRLFHGKHPEADAHAPIGSERSVWNGAVRALARATNEKSVRWLGRGADLATTLLPVALGKKAVALAVEAAGYAGQAE